MDQATNRQRTLWRLSAIAIVIALILFGIYLAASELTQNESAQQLVQDFGYLGVVIVSFIAGLNAIVPVPAGTFVPIFIAAGLDIPLIIIALVTGTMLADLLAWYIGVFGRKLTINFYPRLAHFIEQLRGQNKWVIIIFVFIYSSIAPIPNEVILVPLALSGIRLRILILPLLLGTIIYQTVFTLSAQSVFIRLIG